MKKIVAAALLVLGLVASAQAADTQTGSQNKTGPTGNSSARLRATVVVDMRKGLPAKIELYKGQSLVFENGRGTFVVKDTDKKGTLLTPRPHNTFNQTAAYQAARVGTGEITVTLPSQGMLTVIRTKKIEIVVRPIPPNVRTGGGKP
jgi:hypothetical protein